MRSFVLFAVAFVALVASQEVATLQGAELDQAFQLWKDTYGVQLEAGSEAATKANFAANANAIIAAEAAGEASFASDVNVYSGIDAATFIATRTGAIAPSVIAPVAAALGTGAIVGIAVGSAVAVGAAGGAVAGGVYYAKKKREEADSSNIEMKGRQQPRVDLLAPKNDFTSITARAVPQQL